MVEGFEFGPCPFARLLRGDVHLLRRALTVVPVEVLGEEVLFPTPKAIATGTLESAIQLLPSRVHASPAHEVAAVNFGKMSF